MNNDDELKVKFMEKLIEEFKVFVSDSMKDGMHGEFEDHNDFLRHALDVFIDLKESMEDDL